MIDHPPYVTVTQGVRGYFAVFLVWSDDYGGFYEPENTGVSSYASREEAYPDARSWAASECVEFRP